MPMIENEPRRVAKEETTVHVSKVLVAADPEKVNIDTESYTYIVDPGNPETGVSPMIEVTIRTTISPR